MEGAPELRTAACPKICQARLLPEIARGLRTFGYRVHNRARGDFEIEGISEQLCERFSKRHTQIDEVLAKLLAEKPELSGGNFQGLREQLATSE